MKKKQVLLGILAAGMILGGCSKNSGQDALLDPEKPVTVSLWHYYNGTQKEAFDRMVTEFNETVGSEKGIIVEAYNQGSIGELEKNVISSLKKEPGSMEAPNIFASYADTAYAMEKEGFLAELDDYFTQKELDLYVDSYIEEGRIGSKGELIIFPVAKSTETFMLNVTDWQPFAEAAGADYDMLKTMEGVAGTAKDYYEWTDALTPDIPNDGKAFYGRDAMANLFVIGSMQLGTEIFKVENQQVTVQADRDIMRRIWDFYYVPYISGYFSSYGKFRSDDVKIGEIIALTGSTSSASYFPAEVTSGDLVYPIEYAILPQPVFEGGTDYGVQQGAGLVVKRSARQEEYACVEFLKWFTEESRNLEFSCTSGYLPVQKRANKQELLNTVIEANKLEVNQKIYDTIVFAFHEIEDMKLYTNKAFENGGAARKVLEYHLADKASGDRGIIEEMLAEGVSLNEAAAAFNTDENFEAWYLDFVNALEAAVQ